MCCRKRRHLFAVNLASPRSVPSLPRFRARHARHLPRGCPPHNNVPPGFSPGFFATATFKMSGEFVGDNDVDEADLLAIDLEAIEGNFRVMKIPNICICVL